MSSTPIGRIAWEIGIGLPGFEDVTVTNETIRGQVRVAADTLHEAVSVEFELDAETRTGLSDRIGTIHSVFKEGPEHEESLLHLGSVVMPNVIMLRPNIPEPVAPTSRIILTGNAFREEVFNLSKAATDFGNATGKDAYSSGYEAQVRAFADDTNTLVLTALQLVVARRLLRYGVLPNSVFSTEQLRAVGFNDWLKEHHEISKMPPAKLRKVKHTLLDLYDENNNAAKNMRRTMWPEIFHRLLPFEPDVNHIFTAVYVNQVGKNQQHTTTFLDSLTVKLPKNVVQDTLKNLFAPQSVRPKLV